uniref:DUF5641 domain-containing protein n=1 Tax=Strongyloides venezuelensis TaxID=75913 RepID=A0A0K0EZK8_STRVS
MSEIRNELNKPNVTQGRTSEVMIPSGKEVKPNSGEKSHSKDDGIQKNLYEKQFPKGINTSSSVTKEKVGTSKKKSTELKVKDKVAVYIPKTSKLGPRWKSGYIIMKIEKEEGRTEKYVCKRKGAGRPVIRGKNEIKKILKCQGLSSGRGSEDSPLGLSDE